MRDKLEELKTQTATFRDILPLLEAVAARLAKNHMQEASRRRPSDEALFSFSVTLDPTREDGPMFACDITRPECGQAFDLAESLKHLLDQIETFGQMAGSLRRLGLELGAVTMESGNTGRIYRRSAKLHGHTLELVLTLEDLVYVHLDFTGPDGQDLWIDAQDEVWRIEADGWTENNPLDELMGDATSEPGSVNYSHEGVLEALVERMRNPVKRTTTKTKTRRRRKLRRYAVD